MIGPTSGNGMAITAPIAAAIAVRLATGSSNIVWPPRVYYLYNTRWQSRKGRSGAPVNVDRLLGFREHSADRQARAVTVLDRLLKQFALCTAGDRDQNSPGR